MHTPIAPICLIPYQGQDIAPSAGGFSGAAKGVLGPTPVGARVLRGQQRERNRRSHREVHRNARCRVPRRRFSYHQMNLPAAPARSLGEFSRLSKPSPSGEGRLPAAPCQPDRVEERHPLRRDQDRPRQAQDARALACISTRIWSVPLLGRPRVGALIGRDLEKVIVAEYAL